MNGNALPIIFEDVPSTLPPSGSAGGDLSGTYPDPQVQDDSHNHTGTTLSAITHSSVASANKDGSAGTPSMRTLGTGAQQAAAGNDSRLSDARTPTGHGSTHQHGGSDEIAVSSPAANAIPKSNSSSKLDSWISSASTSTAGLVQLANSGEASSTKAVTGTDVRLSDARVPTGHAASHQHGGSDEIATPTSSANAIPKADSNGLLDSWLALGIWGFYGDGSDGDVTISSGTPLLNRDMFYQNLTVNNGATLLTGGYIVHVSQKLTIVSGGFISDPGNSTTNDAGAAGLGARGTLTTDSGSGASGSSGTGSGANGSVGATPPHHSTATSYQGGTGGSGGGGNNGGTGGNPTPRASSAGTIRSWPAAGLGFAMGSGALRSGGGGGGGGAGGNAGGGGTTKSGGGGGGGGSVVIRCRLLDNSGTISAPGGNGGAATSTGAGSAGGGGGGAGGWVSVCAGRVLNQGTVSANGGSGGAGCGANGTAGNAGNNGFTQILRGGT